MVEIHKYGDTRGVQFIYFTFFREQKPICQAEVIKSGKITTNTGSPQGTVVLLFLLTSKLPTSEFADHTAHLGPIEQDNDSHSTEEI